MTEGVETQRQQDVVSASGADQAQGYFYARPMAASAFDDLLTGAAPGVLHLGVSSPGPGAA